MIAVRRCFVVAIRVALFAATLSAGANAQRAPIVVIVVRHAEKDTLPPDDPPLTAAGAARALALDRALAAAGVQAVITTQLRRTRETARPIAERLGLVVQTVKRDEDITAHARAVAAAVLKEVGKTVLVVGHGETVGPIIAALGGPQIRNLCANEYSHIFVLVLEAGRARFVRSECGAASPASTDGCVPEAPYVPAMASAIDRKCDGLIVLVGGRKLSKPWLDLASSHGRRRRSPSLVA